MTHRLTLIGLALVASLTAATVVHSQQNPYRLKEPDQKKLCLSCHTDFEQKLKSRFIHTPVKTGECSGCHEAHVSSHGKLLSSEPKEICGTCHDKMIPADAKSVHKVVAEGECQKCHDPHGSDNAANLVAKGSDLCFTCHKTLGEAIKKAKFRHSPVEQGCSTCHTPHASDKAGRLLKTAVPGICVNCHKPDIPAFTARHNKYPVGKASCTSCHDPHGSSQPALLLNTVHAPVGAGSCGQCHEAPDSATPFATKRPGYQLCKGCHSEMVNAAMAKKHLHGPVGDREGCVNCHNPHASKQNKLLKAETAQLCGSCHSDTIKRIGAVAAKHAPVDAGTCTACHSPHSADGSHLVDQDTVSKLCSTCHDYQTHSAHPIGEKAVDPRNPNLRVDCLSCHKAHGTDFKRMLLTETNLELCTQCHKKYGR